MMDFETTLKPFVIRYVHNDRQIYGDFAMVTCGL